MRSWSRRPRVVTENGARAFAFEQRVCCDRRSHMDFGDFGLRQVCVLREAKQTPNSFDCRVVVMFGAFGEKFGRAQLAVGPQRNEIGERAATVDPNVPSGFASYVRLNFFERNGRVR